MNKLASFNFDILDHVLSGDLEKVAKVVDGLSDEIKNSTIPDFDEQQDRAQSDFALVTYHPSQGHVNKFARYNKELTELSVAFLAENEEDLPEEILKTASTNLKKAAKEHGISFPAKLASYATKDEFIDPVVDLTQIDEIKYSQKLASSEASSEFALPSQGKYPISTPEQIKQAQQYFDKYAHELGVSDAYEYAVNVKKACQKKDLEVDSYMINKFASVDLEKLSEDFSTHLKIRKSYLKTDDANYGVYDELEKVASEHSPTKLAMALEKIDTEVGNDKFWGAGIENPLFTVGTSGFQKTASTGPSLEELRSLDNADLTGIVGNDVIPELKGEDGKAVYDSLPRPLKKEINALLGY